MASDVTIDIAGPRFDVNEKIKDAIEIFTSIESSCTRFDSTSPLMRANSESNRWHSLPSITIDLIKMAYEAYQLTHGVFDPRILGDLLRNGYDNNQHFVSINALKNEIPSDSPKSTESTIRKLSDWQPEFKANEVLLGELPMDLGGIGKGFAVQRAMEILQDCADGVLINAGGDIAAEGFGEDGEVWRIGIENPWNPEGDSLLVVELTDASIATSSIRLRSWLQNGRLTHHLIDPTTGSPGGLGLMAVSAIAPSTTWAEVWSKTLFLKGLTEIEEYANQIAIAAAWIDESGNVVTNTAFRDQTIWGVTRAPGWAPSGSNRRPTD